MNIYAITKKGVGKPENEDRIIAGKTILSSRKHFTDERCTVIAVADGVGGNAGGAVASHFVANELCLLDHVDEDVLRGINDRLIALSASSDERRTMATTLSGICLSDGGVCLYNVGNSRVYLLQGGKYLKQLTTDDTTAQFLISTGKLKEEELESYDRKNEITACFGGGNPELLKLRIDRLELQSGSFMITSDGVHDHLDADRIEDLIAEYGISLPCCEEIVKAAVANGSEDDMSIIFADI